METPQTGTQVGHYILEEKLGEGGMAEVWRARNAVLGHSAAIKFLNAQFAGNPEVEHRFLEEGKRQAHLQHANIVSAVDFVYVEDRSFLVMRYINGEGLDQRLFKLQRPMPLQAVLSISKDVLGALGYAHSQGVVHRDIKPSNIMLENTGRAYVLDFGIALAMGQRRVTRAGGVIGTPEYMSPEQIVGSRELDHRSDIYSYGCVLYQMLTGVLPFDFDAVGDTEFVVQQKHLYQPVRPLRELNPDIPEQIQRVVMRCLEKQPVDRFASCQELFEALSAPAQQQREFVPIARPIRTPTVVQSPEELAAGLAPRSFSAAASSSTSPQPPQVSSVYSPPVIPEPAVLPPSTPVRAGIQPAVIALAGVLLLGVAGGGFWWMRNQHASDSPSHQVTASVTPPQPGPAATTSTSGTAPHTIHTPKPTRDGNRGATATTSAASSSTAPPIPGPAAGRGDTATNLPPDPATVPPPAPAPTPPTAPQSGVLHCSSVQFGSGSYKGLQGFRFQGIPLNANLDWDRAHWFLHPQPVDSEHKDVTVVPNGANVPPDCEVTWSLSK